MTYEETVEPNLMSPEAFRATLKTRRLKQKELADALGVDSRTVNRWATGRLPIPKYAIAYLGGDPSPPKRKYEVSLVYTVRFEAGSDEEAMRISARLEHQLGVVCDSGPIGSELVSNYASLRELQDVPRIVRWGGEDGTPQQVSTIYDTMRAVDFAPDIVVPIWDEFRRKEAARHPYREASRPASNVVTFPTTR